MVKQFLLSILAIQILITLTNCYYVFPKPETISQGSNIIEINPKYFSISTNVNSLILDQAIQRYQNDILFIFPNNNQNTNKFSVIIQVQSSDESLQLGVDESYTLDIENNDTSCNITANTIYGAMRALETLSEIIDYNPVTAIYAFNCIPVSISDNPRFQWRGLMIDTARHYLTVNTIKRTIDAMSYSKFNTLHWHCVDAESFPIVSESYPEISVYGGYAHGFANYTHHEISDIVSYAQFRGIRVVPEFDVPGHAYSWGLYYPLTVSCPKYEANINNIPLDPTQDYTYNFLNSFFKEMTSLFTDNTFHRGGDEVVYGCWEDNTNVTSWMNQHGITTGTQLEQYFENKLELIIINNLNKTMISWEDTFDNGIDLNPNTILEVWKSGDVLKSIVQAGYRAINAYGYYLNDQTPVPAQYVSQWVDTWQTMYNYDPVAGLNLTEQELELVLGGEAAMWAEQVDSVNFDSRVWPRACGVAERLWSPQSTTDLTDATTRLVEHRCRLAQRGIGAGPIQPDFCLLPSYY